MKGKQKPAPGAPMKPRLAVTMALFLTAVSVDFYLIATHHSRTVILAVLAVVIVLAIAAQIQITTWERR